MQTRDTQRTRLFGDAPNQLLAIIIWASSEGCRQVYHFSCHKLIVQRPHAGRYSLLRQAETISTTYSACQWSLCYGWLVYITASRQLFLNNYQAINYKNKWTQENCICTETEINFRSGYFNYRFRQNVSLKYLFKAEGCFICKDTKNKILNSFFIHLATVITSAFKCK